MRVCAGQARHAASATSRCGRGGVPWQRRLGLVSERARIQPWVLARSREHRIGPRCGLGEFCARARRRGGGAAMAGRRHRLKAAAVVHGAEAGKGLRPGCRAHAHTRRTPGKAMTGPWRRHGARRTTSAAAPRHAGGVDRHGPTQGEQGRRLGALAVAVRTRADIGFTRVAAWPRARHGGARSGEQRVAG